MAKRKIDEQISYNWLFFLLAGGFAAVTVWAVYDETITRREYKSYQETFFEVERDLNHDKVEEEGKRLEANPRYKELRQKLVDLDAQVKARKGEIEKKEAEAQKVGFEAFDKTQAYTFSKSELDESYYYFTKAKHLHLLEPGDEAKRKHYEERKKTYDDLVARTARDEKVMNEGNEKKKKVDGELAALKAEKEITETKKEMEALERPLEEAKRALEKSEKKIGGLLGPATEIVQQNLSEIDKVDRCESCHMGAARGGFELVAQKEFRSHPMRRVLIALHPPEKFGCTSCHDGQGRATTKFYAHAPGPDEDAHAFHEHYWETPLLRGPKGGDGTEYMEAKCRGCHKQEWDLRAELPCESTVECPLAADGKPMVCAEPRPLSAPGAPHASLAEAQAIEAAAAEGKKPAAAPRYCLEVTDEKMKLVVPGKPAEPGALDPANEKDLEKIRKKTRFAPVALAPNLSRGLRVIEEVGCFGCHPIEGYLGKTKPAPDLTRLASKFKDHPGWMVGWIMNPKAFRPNTRMPRFWPEITAPNEYPYAIDVEGKKRQQLEEASAMAAFLLQQSATSKKYTYVLEPLPGGGDAARGKELVATLGCAGCHVVPVDSVKLEHKNRATHFDYGPDLSNVGAKTSEQWIYNWVRDPKRYAPGTRMPNLRLTKEEAASIARFLVQQKGTAKVDEAAPTLTDARLVEHGKELVKKYGCFGCHQVEGFEDTPGIGAELTEFGIKTVERLDFGDYVPDHHAQTWEQWTWNKLKHPRVYAYERVETRMPQFDLADDEIRAIMVVLKGMRGDTPENAVLAKKLSREEETREQGRELVRTYNCMGCHNIDGWTGDLRRLSQYTGENQKYGPPPLEGEGSKAQPSWLFGFLKEPFQMRPLPKVRMPTFGFSDGQATQLVAMFSALDKAVYPFIDYQAVQPTDERQQRIGRALFEFTGCQKCHVVGDLKPGEELPQGVVAPNLLMVKRRLRAEWVARWLADPNALQPGTAMPAFWASQSQLEVGLKSVQNLLGGMSKQELEPYLKSREAQIEAVRNFLFVLTAGAPQAEKPPRETRTAHR